MIPKILHAIWLGDKPLQPLNEMCMASWGRVLPNWEIRVCREVPVECGWAIEAAKTRHYANASNYMRLWLLRRFGGVYLDMDVQLLKKPPVLSPCFIGFQRKDTEQDCINTAVMGCEIGHHFTEDCIRELEHSAPSDHAQVGGCTIPTKVLRGYGMTGLNTRQYVNQVDVYPLEMFHPFDWMRGFQPGCITENTIAIHYWQGNWAK